MDHTRSDQYEEGPDGLPPHWPESMRCAHCEYDLRGLRTGELCPECGLRPDPFVEVAIAGSEFEAAAMIASLSAEGIEARMLPPAGVVGAIGVLGGPGSAPVPVAVRARDEPGARAVLGPGACDEYGDPLEWDDCDEMDGASEHSGRSVLAALGVLFVLMMVMLLAFGYVVTRFLP